jgi:nicotinate phosphoribosyltransferase
MFHAAKYGYRMANEMAMEAWVSVFGGNLGIVLPDTFTTEAFLRSFNTKFAKLYDGPRQDSGDPKKFTDLFLEHYKKLGVDPKLKSIIYSNDINSKEKCREITDYARGKFLTSSLGIGTWFTNDVGVKPLNQVIKMVAARPDGIGDWVNTIKLGDDVSKNTGDTTEREHAMHELGIQNKAVPVEA